MFDMENLREVENDLLQAESRVSAAYVYMEKAVAVLDAMGNTLFGECDDLNYRLYFDKCKTLYAVARDNIISAMESIND